MLLLIAIALPLSTSIGPVDTALDKTEAPNSLRAAFTVELSSQSASRIFDYDPREPKERRWLLISAVGEDADLDAVAAHWGAEASPDGRLFPDDLRASLGNEVDAEDLGMAWRIHFKHEPSINDGRYDIWAASRMRASAWLDPQGDRFVRIDYTLPKPVNGPDGGKIRRYNQSYYLETEPLYGMSFVSAFTIDLEARAAFKTFRRSYSARVLQAEFFFANKQAEQAFVEMRQIGTGGNRQPR